jgi:CRP-like cAMP-binding protein
MLVRPDLPTPSSEVRESTRSSAVNERRLRKGAALDFPERAGALELRVISGCMRLCHPLMNGRRQITDFLLPGDRIGIAEVRIHNGSLEAVTPVTLVLFQPEAPFVGAGADGSAYRERLEALQAHVFLLGHKNAREKLVAFLLEMSDRLAQGGDCFRLPMSRYDIADYLCISPETVCRNFTQLVTDGLVSLPDSQSVRLLHRASLEFIAR